MAELTNLESKLAEVLGLAAAAKGAAEKVKGEDEALDGFEFLTMAEAGEVGHRSIVRKFNERAGISSVTELTEWALPIQEAHLSKALESSLVLAGREDPNEPAE